MASDSIRPVQCHPASMTPFHMSLELNYEDVTLIWADENVNENVDCLDTKCRLNTIVNYFKVFDNGQETIDYIQSTSDEHLFLIVSGLLGEIIISQIYDKSQVKFIYVFCINKEKHCEWAHKYSKVCGVFIDKYELFQHLTTQVRSYEKSLMDISIFSRTSMAAEENSIRDYMIEDNISLMWLQLFFDILLHLPFDKNLAKQDMIAECRLYYQNNAVEFKKIDEFENDYCFEKVIHWYTRDSFVYRLVNKALRTLNIDIIFKFRFLIIDLYQQLKQRHIAYIESLSTTDQNKIIHTVYRSQHIGTNDIAKLKENIGNIICPNSFFSTTNNFLMAQGFVAGSCDSECILFQIDIPDSYYSTIANALQYTRPFLRLENLSQFENENEVIFSMGTLFRIESVEKEHMWYVCLKFEGENDELGKEFYRTEELEKEKHDWQSRSSIEDRILLLAEKLPESNRSLFSIYIKYSIFADENHLTTTETLTKYRKGFELLVKCLPDYQDIIIIAMHLSIGLLYSNRGERILAMQFGETALQIVETCSHIDHDCLLICYDYLAVIHQLEDQYTEALSIYEKMLSIATEKDHKSALLAIYDRIRLITCDAHDYDYELICLQKMVELRKILACEDKAMTYMDFGLFYEGKKDFRIALFYYKQNFRCLLQRNAHMTDLMRTYSRIGIMYENMNHHIAAVQVYIRILLVELMSLPSYNRSILRTYDIVINCIQRLINCNCRKKLRYYFRLLMSRSSSSTIFNIFINKIKFLFDFGLNRQMSFKASLNILLTHIQLEQNNRRMYESSLKDLHRLIKKILRVKSLCFAKIYHNRQMLQELQSTLNDYQRYLYLIQQAYFSTAHVNIYKARANDASIQRCATDIGRVIHAFNQSSHATICQDRIQLKPRQRHRAPEIYRYRFCGCFINSSTVRNRFNRRWVRFSQI